MNKDTCSFCDKTRNEVDKLIVSGDAGICNECVELCGSILIKETNDKLRRDRKINKNLDPEKIKAYLDDFIIGQDQAKMHLVVGVVNHYKRVFFEHKVKLEKSNILVFGPTGSGKTLLAKTVAEYLNVPFVIADSTTLTEAGYVGDDVETVISRLFTASNFDKELCERGIVFLDEIDKIGRKSENPSIVRDVSGEGVQQALLKLVEGTTCRINGSGSKKHPGVDQIEIDTSNILFIAGGAFSGLENIIERRRRGTSIGFHDNALAETSSLFDAAADDFVKFGMIPEFTGRFPIMVPVNALTVDDYVHILTEPKNNIIEQMKFYFETDGIELTFSNDAILTIAELAVNMATGARALKTIVEGSLVPLMFNIRNLHKQGYKKVEITSDFIKYQTLPNFS